VLHLNAIKDNSDGKDVDVPAPPFAYTLFAWRRKMGVGYFEALRMPVDVIMTDIEMMNLEAEYGPQHATMENKQEE